MPLSIDLAFCLESETIFIGLRSFVVMIMENTIILEMSEIGYSH